MKCNDPSTWPEPSAEYACEDVGYGAVRVRAWAKLHPKVCAHEGRGSRGPLPIVVGTLVLVEVERLPRGERWRKPRVLWLWWHGPEGEAPNLELNWRAYELARIGSQLFVYDSTTRNQTAALQSFDTFTTRLSAQPLRRAIRPGAYFPLSQAGFGMDHASGPLPRAGRPVDVAGGGRFCPA
jgi:hypothetical protein